MANTLKVYLNSSKVPQKPLDCLSLKRPKQIGGKSGRTTRLAARVYGNMRTLLIEKIDCRSFKYL